MMRSASKHVARGVGVLDPEDADGSVAVRGVCEHVFV